MSFQYYLANVGENQKKLIRGNPSDLLSFSVFNPKKLEWDVSRGISWAERLLESGFSDFSVISESDAIRFMRR